MDAEASCSALFIAKQVWKWVKWQLEGHTRIALYVSSISIAQQTQKTCISACVNHITRRGLSKADLHGTSVPLALLETLRGWSCSLDNNSAQNPCCAIPYRGHKQLHLYFPAERPRFLMIQTWREQGTKTPSKTCPGNFLLPQTTHCKGRWPYSPTHPQVFPSS